MNIKAVVLVVLLIAGVSLAVIPAGSSAAGGVHPGGYASVEGMAVTYDGSTDVGRLLIQLEEHPKASNLSVIVMSDDDIEEFPTIGSDIMFLLNINPLSYGKCLVQVSEYEGDVIAQCYVDIVESYTVSIDRNGGSGYMPFISATEGSVVTLPECILVAPEGATFSGWQAAEKSYQPGEHFTVVSDTTLKALWSHEDSPGDGGVDVPIIVLFVGVVVVAATLIFIIIRRNTNA